MALSSRFLLGSLVISLLIALGYSQNQSICLYSSGNSATLKPLRIFNSNCPRNTSYCMNAVYAYSPTTFAYGGVASLKPAVGEVVQFLSQDDYGNITFVMIMDTSIQTASTVTCQITGALPGVNILLKDDPGDTWNWDPSTNSGTFKWTTQPGYTDGVILGPITFVENYCIQTSFVQSGGAISKVSILSGNITNVQRVISQNYTSGSAFKFCQYPTTLTNYVNATCPNTNDGRANISIVYGPDNVQYLWTLNGTTIATTPSVTGLSAGTYTIYVNDPSSNGCDATRMVTIYDHTLNGAFVKTTPFNCTVKGTASATPNGGAGGWSYSWYTSTGTTAIGTGTTISGLAQGSYYVKVTDSCGSVATTSFTIGTAGCCGDGICQTNEMCHTAKYCMADCGVCCGSGYIVSNNMCQVCPAGSMSTTQQSTSCTPCPANTFNAGGNDTCAPCPTNYFSAAGSGKCTRCPAGQVRATTDASCSSCSAGSYAPACDNSACTTCVAGTYSEDGATTCMTCPAGTLSSAGASSCSQCAMGTYSMAGASSCSSCPSGETTAMAGSTHPLACWDDSLFSM